MPLINSASLVERDGQMFASDRQLSSFEIYQLYNGLDCCLTTEIAEVLAPKVGASPEATLIYSFERAMQGPALDMMRRGWRVDQYERYKSISDLQARRAKMEHLLDRYAHVIWNRGLNPGSPKQMKDFFYYSPQGLRLPEQHKIDKGVRKVSCDRECLEKLRAYFYAVPIINVILALRDIDKKLGVLLTEVDADSRMRTSYNVAGTETGRWSSSANAFGSGTNLQNITPELRKMFVADPGMKLCYADLEQAESRVVGLLVWMCTGDPSYLDACESGDLHTLVAKLVWPKLGWTGDPKADRKIADQPFYRQYSYRDMAKRGGHGTNYYGQPRTMAMHLKVETSIMEAFQHGYFKAFPGIRLWHTWTSAQLTTKQCLTTPLGRQRHFFGRPNDDSTLREAIAFVPQSTVGDLLNLALWLVWHHMPEVQLLGQIHDAIVFQYPEKRELEIIPKALSLLRIPITASGIHRGSVFFPSNLTLTRTMTIPSECKIGWNWADDEIRSSVGNKKLPNPDGLKKWKGVEDERRRHAGFSVVL